MTHLVEALRRETAKCLSKAPRTRHVSTLGDNKLPEWRLGADAFESLRNWFDEQRPTGGKSMALEGGLDGLRFRLDDTVPDNTARLLWPDGTYSVEIEIDAPGP